MLDGVYEVLAQLISSIESNLDVFIFWMGVLWSIQLVNFCLGRRLCVLGIHPRCWWGLPGVVFSPFLHVDFGHLLMNSVGLVVLGNLLSVHGVDYMLNIAVVSALIGGGLVWLFGRNMIHVGASGVVMGLAGGLCVVAYEQNSMYAYFLAGLLFYFFEHLAVNLIPGEAGTSWEGHVFGFVGGMLAEHFHINILPFVASLN